MCLFYFPNYIKHVFLFVASKTTITFFASVLEEMMCNPFYVFDSESI